MARAALLDLYGTLVEPDWASLNAGRSAIALRAGVVPEEAHRAWEATHVDRMLGRYGALEGDLAAVISLAGGSVGGPLLRELADAERENWRRGVAVYPDVVAALAELREAGLRLGIVTNASAEAAAVIPALGLGRLVDVVVASCEPRMLKPEVLHVAIERLGVGTSEVTLVDDEPGQVAAAREHGVDAVLIRRAGGERSAAGAGGTAVISALTELPALLASGAQERRR